MEARMADLKAGDSPHEFYNHFMEEQHLTKQVMSELKHAITDLRKDLKHEIAQLKIIHDHDVKTSNKELEMKMYNFITRAVITTVGLLGGLQSFLHFIH